MSRGAATGAALAVPKLWTLDTSHPSLLGVACAAQPCHVTHAQVLWYFYSNSPWELARGVTWRECRTAVVRHSHGQEPGWAMAMARPTLGDRSAHAALYRLGRALMQHIARETRRRLLRPGGRRNPASRASAMFDA